VYLFFFKKKWFKIISIYLFWIWTKKFYERRSAMENVMPIKCQLGDFIPVIGFTNGRKKTKLNNSISFSRLNTSTRVLKITLQKAILPAWISQLLVYGGFVNLKGRRGKKLIGFKSMTTRPQRNMSKPEVRILIHKQWN